MATKGFSKNKTRPINHPPQGKEVPAHNSVFWRASRRYENKWDWRGSRGELEAVQGRSPEGTPGDASLLIKKRDEVQFWFSWCFSGNGLIFVQFLLQITNAKDKVHNVFLQDVKITQRNPSVRYYWTNISIKNIPILGKLIAALTEISLWKFISILPITAPLILYLSFRFGMKKGYPTNSKKSGGNKTPNYTAAYLTSVGQLICEFLKPVLGRSNPEDYKRTTPTSPLS